MKKSPYNVSRRSALKMMCASVAGTVLSASGIMTLSASCSTKQRRIILYFTGTGNSLHVAREAIGDYRKASPSPMATVSSALPVFKIVLRKRYAFPTEKATT